MRRYEDNIKTGDEQVNVHPMPETTPKETDATLFRKEWNGEPVEENQPLPHNFPLNTLVETKFDATFDKGACWKVHGRFFVVKQTRNEVGSPQYSISLWPVGHQALKIVGQVFHGIDEGRLTPVDVSDSSELDPLTWDEL